MKQITTSDLRLGNWLYYTNETKFLMQVVAIGDDWVQLDFEGNDGDCFENTDKEIYPIPFTEKFLAIIGTCVNSVKWRIGGTDSINVSVMTDIYQYLCLAII